MKQDAFKNLPRSFQGLWLKLKDGISARIERASEKRGTQKRKIERAEKDLIVGRFSIEIEGL